MIGVHGLDNRPVAQPHFRRRAAKKGATVRAGQGGSFSVEQIAQLYDFPGGETGAGQCIAIIELKAGPGWDACSGLGVPNGAALQNLPAA